MRRWVAVAGLIAVAGATDVAWAANYDLLVVDQFAHSIVGIDVQTGTQEVLARRTTLLDPRGVTSLPDGRIVVASTGAGVLVAIDPDSGERNHLWERDSSGAPGSVVADGGAALYVGTQRVAGSPGVAAAIYRLDLTSREATLVSEGAAPAACGPDAVLLCSPAGLALGSDGALYAADPDAQKILRIDIATGAQTVVSPPAGLPPEENFLGHPQALDFDASGQLVVATELSGSGAILRVDPVSGAQTIVMGSSLFEMPRALRVASDGRYYVADRLYDHVVRVDPTKTPPTQGLFAEGIGAGGLLDGPAGLSLDEDDNVFVSNVGTDALVRVDGQTRGQVQLARGGSLEDPYALAIDAQGRALVADASAAAVIRVDLATGGQVRLSSGGALKRPQGIAIKPNGSVLVPDLMARSVVQIDPQTGAQSILATLPAGSGPAGIAVASDGATWIGDRFRNAIVRIDSSGAQEIVAQHGLLDEPNALAFDAQGALLVCDRASIVRVDPANGAQSLLTSGAASAWLLGLAPTAAGDIFATDGIAQSVVRVSPTGTQETVSSGGAFEFPTGVVLAPAPSIGVGNLVALAALSAYAFRRRRIPRGCTARHGSS